jgi:hypothetical protein
MVASLLLALAALRAGLALRRSRRGLAPRAPGLRRRHLRLAKPAVWLIAIGFVGGPLSIWLFRGREPFGTVHAWLGLVAAGLFGIAAGLGRSLERGRGRSPDVHALVGTVALLVAAVAAVAGFVLLP